MSGQKVSNNPLGSYTVKVIRTDTGEEIQEASIASLLSIRVDEAGPNFYYYAWALPGTSESVAEWRISRWTVASPQKLLWADGDTDFDNVWADRASLSYS